MDTVLREARMPRGKLITFEGIDGSGKSTQVKIAYSYLTRKGLKCKLLREPGGTKVGEAIRDILLISAEEDLAMNRCTEYLLFVAARAELSRTVIKPLLEDGCTVLLDRFSDSSSAYQGYGHGVDLDFIRRTNLIATDGLKPDLTILLDIEPETALSRPGDFDDRIEKMGLDFFRRVREGFLAIAVAEPDRFRVVDASEDVTTIAGKVRAFIEELLA